MFDQASLIVSTQEDRWPFVLQKQKKKIAGPFQHTVIVILMVYSVSTMALSFVGNFCRWAPTQLHSAHLTLFFSPHLLPAWFPVFLRAYSWRCRIILHGVLLVGHLGFCFVGHLRLVPALPVLQFYFKLHTLCFWLRFGCPRRCLWRFGGVSNDLSEGQRGGVAGNWFVGLKILFFS